MEVYILSNQKVKKLCEYIEKTRGANYPIGNLLLSDASDYMINSYFKMLAVLLHQCDPNDNQMNLFRRLILAITKDYIAEDYMRQALTIEISDYENFIAEYKEHDLRYRFAVDGMLLSALNHKSTAAMTLLAGMIEDLGIRKTELENLSQLCKSILGQDMAIYREVEKTKPQNIDYGWFQTYLQLYVSMTRSITEDELIIQSREKYCEFDATELSKITKNKVLLKGLSINMANNPIEFVSCDKIELIDCRFIAGQQSITFISCKEIVIKGCKFENFTTRVIIEDDNSDIVIGDSEFIDCMYHFERSYDDWKSMGGVIYSKNLNRITNVTLVQSTFKNCGVINSSNYYSSHIIANCNGMVVKECKFLNCWGYYNNINKDPENRKRGLFHINTTGEDNEIIGSAEFMSKY